MKSIVKKKHQKFCNKPTIFSQNSPGAEPAFYFQSALLIVMQTPVLQQGNMFVLPSSQLLGQSCNTPKFFEEKKTYWLFFGRKMNVSTSLISSINFHSVPFCRKAHNFHWYSVSSLSIFKVRPVCTKPMMSSPPFRRLSIFSLSHTNNSTDIFWQSTNECSNVLANIRLERVFFYFATGSHILKEVKSG